MHAEQHAGDFEIRIDALADQVRCLEELAETLQGQEVRLQRDQDFLGGGQGVQREQPQGRRTIDQAEVEFVLAVLHRLAQDDLPADDVDQLGLSADQMDAGAEQPQVGSHEHQARLERGGLGQHLVGAGLDLLRLDAEVDGQMRLRIEIDDDDPLPRHGHRGRHVDRRGRLTDPPFLIQDCNRSQSVALTSGRLRVRRHGASSGWRRAHR